MVTHELKTWPDFLEAILRKEKTFEVRKNDRGFQKGDLLLLKAYHPKEGPSGSGSYMKKNYSSGEYYSTSKREASFQTVKVSYVLNGEQFGIMPDYVVMGIKIR